MNYCDDEYELEDSEIRQKLEAIIKLPCSIELEKMIKARKAVSRADFESLKKAAETLIAVFKEQEVPSDFWMVRDETQPEQGYQSFIGIIPSLLQEGYDHETKKPQPAIARMSAIYQSQRVELADLHPQHDDSPSFSYSLAERLSTRACPIYSLGGPP